MSDESWLGPSEAAAKLGVTVKALRVYEREGLVAPARTTGKWRAYGPSQISRIHMIVVMREMGLSLKNIRTLLNGRVVELAQLLMTQQEALEERRRRISGAITLLTDARLKIAQGHSLSMDDLTQLSRETVMEHPKLSPEIKDRLKAHLGNHLPPDQIEGLAAGMIRQIDEAGIVKSDLMTEFNILIAEIRAVMAAGDPDSDAAKAAIRRWKEVTRDINRPTPEVRQAWKRGVDEALADPALKDKLPFDAEVFDFLQKVQDGMKARGELD